MVRQQFIVLVLDHTPFGESTPFEDKGQRGMTIIMGTGDVLGTSQLALRAAETMRCGVYLRKQADVDPQRIAVAGLCQGGQDTWLSAALDDEFCAAAPICSETTFTIHMVDMASYFGNADSSPFPFGILNVCDIDHLHAAIAPRPTARRRHPHSPSYTSGVLKERAGRTPRVRIDVGLAPARGLQQLWPVP